MGDIFVSYRRDPASAWAGRVADRLRAHFGARKVFMDVVDLAPGVDFPAEVAETIQRVKVLLAIIDRHWTGPDGVSVRPLGDDDWVTREVELALRNPRLAVIPVLVDGARMPAPEELPAGIRGLASRNAVVLSPTNFDQDLKRLIGALEQAGVDKSALKRVGLARSLFICALLGAALLFGAARAIDTAEQHSLRADASGPTVRLQGLSWERFEVTNRRYRACVDAGRCDAPGTARTGERFDTPDRADLPVVSVRADQARAFCTWIGRRLPTRAEWRAVATRGGTASWPWGDDPPTASRVNAVIVGAASSELSQALKRSFARLARRQHVTGADITRLIPGATDQAVHQLLEDWPYVPRDIRTGGLEQLYDESAPDPDPDSADDVVPVTSDRDGGTSLAGGAQHLVGNAAEWTSTTLDGGTWDGTSAAALYVAGGSFAELSDALKSALWVSSEEPMDTVGFRCVESR